MFVKEGLREPHPRARNRVYRVGDSGGVEQRQAEDASREIRENEMEEKHARRGKIRPASHRMNARGFGMRSPKFESERESSPLFNRDPLYAADAIANSTFGRAERRDDDAAEGL